MEAVFILGVAFQVAGEVEKARETQHFEFERQRQLEAEARQIQIQALDEENQRLEELRYANAAVIAGAGNIDPFGSPSLIALRKKNLETAQEDVFAIRDNLRFERGQIKSAIRLSNRRIKSARTQGLFNVLSTVGQGAYQFSKFG